MFSLQKFVEEVYVDVADFRTWAGDIDLKSMSKEDVDRLINYWYSSKRKL